MNQQQQPVNYETWNHHCKYIKPLLRCVVLIYGFYYIYSNEFFIARTYQVPQYGTRNQVQEPTLPGDSRTGTWFLVPLSDILVVFLFYTPHFINFIFRELNCFYYMNTRTTWYYHQRRTRPQTNTVFFYLVLGPEGIGMYIAMSKITTPATRSMREKQRLEVLSMLPYSCGSAVSWGSAVSGAVDNQ